MATNGGPHTADLCARATAAQIGSSVVIMGYSQDAMAAAEDKRRMIAALIQRLVKPYATFMELERNALAEDASRLDAPLSGGSLLDEALQIVMDESRSFKPHFEAIKDTLRDLLSSHFATMVQIERRWHCHRLLEQDPAHEKAMTFLGL